MATMHVMLHPTLNKGTYQFAHCHSLAPAHVSAVVATAVVTCAVATAVVACAVATAVVTCAVATAVTLRCRTCVCIHVHAMFMMTLLGKLPIPRLPCIIQLPSAVHFDHIHFLVCMCFTAIIFKVCFAKIDQFHA